MQRTLLAMGHGVWGGFAPQAGRGRGWRPHGRPHSPVWFVQESASMQRTLLAMGHGVALHVAPKLEGAGRGDAATTARETSGRAAASSKQQQARDPRWEIRIYRIWPAAKYKCIWLYLQAPAPYFPSRRGTRREGGSSRVEGGAPTAC
eukprot:scaffold109312_cov36-Tisochrysis_lutea.AAC.1